MFFELVLFGDNLTFMKTEPAKIAHFYVMTCSDVTQVLRNRSISILPGK